MSSEKRYTIMFVDDDEIDQLVYQRIVRRVDNVSESIHVTSAEDALDLLKSRPSFLPDVLFLDINMPCMSGLEFLDEVSQNKNMIKKFDSIAVVVLTTSIARADEQELQKFACVRRLESKPLTDESLELILTSMKRSG